MLQKLTCFTLFVLSSLRPAAVAAATMPEPELIPMDCPVQLNRIPAYFTCASLPVPENRSKPDSRTIFLTVYLAHRKSTTFDADNLPALFLHGGPGLGILDTLLEGDLGGFDPKVLEQRDWVFFDQRGVGRSYPALKCPLSGTEEDCLATIQATGADLTGYSTEENAADVDALRRALHVPQVHLYGVSYGTRLALVTNRLFPGTVKSMALDGVESDDYGQRRHSALITAHAAVNLLEACHRDPVCRASYPKIIEVAERAINKLNINPLTIDGAPQYGDDFVENLFSNQYYYKNLKYYPALYQAADNGTLNSLSVLQDPNLQAELDSFSQGVVRAVECGEEDNPADIPALEDLSKTGSPFQGVFARGALIQFSVCAPWNIPFRGRPVPVLSNTPTILFSGEFDPTTPPVNAFKTSLTLRNSFNIVFPNLGHVALTATSCPALIANQLFSGRPFRQLDISCVNQTSQIHWFTGPLP